jgi:hypothetical protein
VWPSDGNDDIIYVAVRVRANINLGYIYSVVVKFSGIDASSLVYIETTSSATFANGLIIARYYLVGTSNHDAFVIASGVDRPKNASLTVVAFLVLTDNNNTNHQFLATSEITYFNGTAYRQINIPAELGVITS